MRSVEEEMWVRGKALKEARIKAKITAREEKEEERRMLVEEWRLLRLYPAKEFIASGFLQERSSGMKAREEWYRFHIPEEKDDHEVVLQLWVKRSGEEPTFIGEAGDLYSLDLEIPSGLALSINILVKSAESKLNPRLLTQYSVFDLGIRF